MITVYSADWCGYCKMVKQYLTQKGVEFTEKNVETDPGAADESVAKSGQRGIPVTDINGQIIIGFDRPTIDHALEQIK